MPSLREPEAHLAYDPATGVGNASFVNLDLQQDIRELLSELKVVRHASLAQDGTVPPADCSTETICAWVAAGKEGDTEALAHLFRLQNSISGVLSSTSMEMSAQVSVCGIDKLDYCVEEAAPYRQIQLEPSTSASTCDATANPIRWHTQPSSVSSDPTPASNRVPLLAPLPPRSSNSPGEQHDILDACMLDIKALQQASGLEEVITQVETGAVAEMRRLYGPRDRNKGGTPEWKNLKCTVNKRE
jgi:hypothetical protein